MRVDAAAADDDVVVPTQPSDRASAWLRETPAVRIDATGHAAVARPFESAHTADRYAGACCLLPAGCTGDDVPPILILPSLVAQHIHAEQLYLYVDSILRNAAFASAAPYTYRRSNSELVASLRSLLESLPPSKLEAGPSAYWSCDAKTNTISIPSPDAVEKNVDDDARPDLDVTAKLFYLCPSDTSPTDAPRMPASWAGDALEALRRVTGVDEVDTFIVNFPGVIYPEDSNGCDDCDEPPATNGYSADGADGTVDSRYMRAVLSAYSAIAQDERIRSLGIANFSLEPLRDFLGGLEPATRRPRVNQVNLRDCCSVSKSLLSYASENGIELLTHADCSDLLPPKTFRQLLDDAGPSLPDALRLAPWAARWVLKYTIVHRTRNVVKDKGYVVYAGL